MLLLIGAAAPEVP